MLACLDEALRRYPPVAVGMPRTVPAGRRRPLPASTSPENSTVRRLAPEPATRAPATSRIPSPTSRSGGIDHDEKSRDRLDAVQPFHIGPRNCIGKNLAYSEMRLILARLLYSFDLELVDKDKDWFDQKTFVLRDKPALNVYLTPVSR
ncbi:hypothetical protein RB596_009612 [Gaeumannomyces avenae]